MVMMKFDEKIVEKIKIVPISLEHIGNFRFEIPDSQSILYMIIYDHMISTYIYICGREIFFSHFFKI